MADNRESFTFIWKIENFSFNYDRYICSPYFFAPEMSGPEYAFCLFINNAAISDFISCSIGCLINESNTRLNQFELDYELSFLSGDGTLLKSEKFLKEVVKAWFIFHKITCEKRRRVFLKKDRFIPDDTLTIRCRLWRSGESISPVGRCLAKTRAQIECLIFSGTIDMSCLTPGAKYPVNVKSSSSEVPSFSVSLSIAADSLLNIEIKPLKSINYYKCEIFVLDRYENELKSGQSESKFSVNKLLNIPLTFSKDYLVKYKEIFLPHDKLTIHCKIILLKKYVSEIEFIFGCEDAQARPTDVSSNDTRVENLTTLKDDWNSLFREGILSDAKLMTATETFPVHSVVLSARSPVFKSMFTNDMKEKTNRCVEIDDLDADTVRRMLLFLYSDTLDDLECESAKGLYFAADKYNIVSLRQRCSNFLKQNLLKSNCVDILLLADEHQDKDLKNVVQDYIAINDEAVLDSDEWKNLEENHSRLTTQVFRFIYIKNRKN